jgi:hypothetical protein
MIMTASTCPLLVHFGHIGRYMANDNVLILYWSHTYGKLTVNFYVQRHFAHDQVRGCYQSMTESFGFYPGDQVIWDPYSIASIKARYPGGLSIMCTRDQEYWLTKCKIVFDIIVEEMSQQRVMRQFNILQAVVPSPTDEPLLSEIHM